MCPNGKLQRSNFVELYRQMFPEGKSANFYHHMFRVYDTDRSGTLEFQEFIQVCLPRGKIAGGAMSPRENRYRWATGWATQKAENIESDVCFES